MKKLLYLFLTVLIVACSGDDGNESNNNDSNLFRNIYNNTFWSVNGGLITFSPDKLWYQYFSQNEGGCTFIEEGSFENLRVNDCLFENVTYVVINENSNSLSFRGIYTNGTPIENSSTPCPNVEENYIFQLLNDNIIEIVISSDNYNESFTLIRSNESFLTNTCEFAWDSY